METQAPTQNPPVDLEAQAWRHLIQTVIAILPPAPGNTPEATRTRNRAAIARIAALAPVNANEAELAAQCIVARAQAEEIVRLIRVHADDIKLVVKLNAQYRAIFELSLAANNRLVRDQQQRRKRESNHQDADLDAWTRHIAAQAMLDALPEEPKTDPESQSVGNETPTGRPASLHPTWNPDADPAAGNEDIDIAGGWPGDAAISFHPAGVRSGPS